MAIPTLYPTFQRWAATGSIYILSDTHFADPDCALMAPDWVTPAEQIKRINAKAHKNDTLILLGDIGDSSYLTQLKAGYKVLICGNHDGGAETYAPYFDEIYTGALTIAEKIILSHEPLDINWALNIHGHNHAGDFHPDDYHLNLAANVCNYTPFSLGNIIKHGFLKPIDSIHRQTINNASAQKEKHYEKNYNA